MSVAEVPSRDVPPIDVSDEGFTVELLTGDVILTGTPAGVGALHPRPVGAEDATTA